MSNGFFTILFWVGIVMLMDGAFGLLFQERWQKLAGKLNIRRIALFEIGAALVILIIYYLSLLNLY